MLSHYLPFTINAKLREAKYGLKGNTKLTNAQIKELTGYFEHKRRKTDVRNLVPYELWKGNQAEPEDMDVGKVQSISVNFRGREIQGTTLGFISVGCKSLPIYQINQFMEPNMDMLGKEYELEVWQQMSDISELTAAISAISIQEAEDEISFYETIVNTEVAPTNAAIAASSVTAPVGNTCINTESQPRPDTATIPYIVLTPPEDYFYLQSVVL